MILVKSITGGVLSAVLAWGILIIVYAKRVSQVGTQRGDNGLIAVAGGWDYLLQRPPVVVMLAAAFGLGVYLTARWVAAGKV